MRKLIHEVWTLEVVAVRALVLLDVHVMVDLMGSSGSIPDITSDPLRSKKDARAAKYFSPEGLMTFSCCITRTRVQ